MTVALSSQKLKQWIGNAIEGFRSNDLLGVPEPWLKIYESLADYISGVNPVDEQLTWMIEGTDDTIADVVYQLQRLKRALVGEILAENAHDELSSVLDWFDQAIVNLVERASGSISEERGLSMPYETVFWKARDGMYISTVEGKFLHCNQALMDMLGYQTMEALLRVDIQKDLYVDDGQRQVMVDHLLKDGFYDHHEIHFRTSSGETKSALESCYLVSLPNGKRFIVGIMVDITSEKDLERKTEEYLRTMEQRRVEDNLSLRRFTKRFEALQKVNDYPVLMVDLKAFKIVSYNPAFTKLFKFTRKQIDTMTLRNLFNKGDWMEIFNQISSAGPQRVQFHIPNVICITSDDERFPADLSIVLHHSDEDAALFVQIEDRFEVAQLEQQIADLDDNLEQFLEGSPIGIIGFRSDGSIARVNRYFARCMGYRTYQLKNLSVLNKLFFHDEPRLKLNKYVRRFLRGEHAEGVPLELETKSGTLRRFNLFTVPYYFEGKDKAGFLAILKEGDDFQESSEAGEASREQRERDQELIGLHKTVDQLKSKAIFRQDFLKELAKKFKIPIHVVLGYASLLKKDLNDVLDESQVEDMDIIRDHIMFVLTMLEKAVEYFQLDDGEIQFLPESCKVRPMLDELFERLTPQEVPAGISFEKGHQVLSLDLEVMCDLPLLENMLRHIVDNALDYTRSGQVSLGAYEEDSFLWITVKDTGVGIDDPDKAFEPFFQDDLEHPPESRGLGLGLPIVRMYAALMGATVLIEPREKGGSSVQVVLPLKQEE